MYNFSRRRFYICLYVPNLILNFAGPAIFIYCCLYIVDIYCNQEIFSDRRDNVDGLHIDRSMLARVLIWYKLWQPIDPLIDSVKCKHLPHIIFNVRLNRLTMPSLWRLNNNWCAFSRIVARQYCKILFPYRSVDFLDIFCSNYFSDSFSRLASTFTERDMTHAYLLNTLIMSM